MTEFKKGVFYVTELTKLNRLSFSDLNSINMVYEKPLFIISPTSEKIIVILQYIGDNTFKEILTNTQIKIEPNHEKEESVLRGCDFKNIYEDYEGTILFVKSDDINRMTELDKNNFLKTNHTNFKQLLFKIDRITKKQLSDEIKLANIYPEEYIILSSGTEIFKDPSKKKNSY